MSIEEKLSKSILYNLNVLKYAVKSNDQLDEVLTEGIFLKSNTQAFIQVTYYLFNIIDAKEFRKKFYWPIVDKKSENSYRTSSVEFINMQIDKHSLQQEKIKQVTVVHPSGKKFMSLLLDLIQIAIKEVMRRKKFNSLKSMNIDNAMEIATTINQVENDLMSSLRAEMRVIKEKTQEIQELLTRVCPDMAEDDDEFEDMIKSWHSLNVQRLNAIKETQLRVKNVFKNAKLLQDKAEEMLSDKKYSVVQPSASELEKINEFYQHTTAAPNDGNKLSIVSLIGHLQSALPIILNYVRNFSYDQAEVSDEEMRIVRQKLSELEKFDSVISKMLEKEKFINEKIIKLRAEKEMTKEVEFSFALDDDGAEDKAMKEAEEQDALRIMLSPCYQFDASKNCLASVVHKRNHLVFADAEDENILERSVFLNQSKFNLNSPLNRSRKEMPPPPKLANPLPSRRRRRDAMELLEQATTSKRCDLNSTSKYSNNGSNLKVHSTPLSSTFLSPDLIHHAENFNLSSISAISLMTPIPKPTIQPDVLHPSKENVANLPWHDSQKMKEIQLSPVTKIDPLVSLEDAFGTVISSSSITILPKIKLNDNEDDTLKNSPLSKDSEVTICENFAVFRKKSEDEDLFNISDTILVTE